MNKVKLSIASDHAGYGLKESLKERLADEVDFVDLGTNSEESVDYPDFGIKLAENISSGKTERGVIICGSGVGISIAANRNPKVRAALCCSEEIAKLARQHNDANVIALGARFLSEEQAVNMVRTFISTEFEGGRHERRVNKLSC